MFLLTRNVSPNTVLICDYSKDKIMPYDWYYEDKKNNLKITIDSYKTIMNELIGTEFYTDATEHEEIEKQFNQEREQTVIEKIYESIEENLT